MAELLTLRVVHIVSGIFWLGAGLFSTFFLMPALGSAGPAAGKVMQGLQQRKLFTAMPVAALLTMLSGIRMLWITGGGSTSAIMASSVARTFAIGGIIAIVGFLVGMTMSRPASIKAGALGARLASMDASAEREKLSAELEALRQRSYVWTMVATLLLLASAIAMAVARYL